MSIPPNKDTEAEMAPLTIDNPEDKTLDRIISEHQRLSEKLQQNGVKPVNADLRAVTLLLKRYQFEVESLPL